VKARLWFTVGTLVAALLIVTYALITLPACSEMTGAGYCWGDQ
jgi:hypothetical protein